MDHDDDGETSYNTFVDDVAFEPTYLQALLTAAGRNVATLTQTHSFFRIFHSDLLSSSILKLKFCHLILTLSVVL